MQSRQADATDQYQILHAVEVMVRRYGEHAPHEAAIRSKELYDRGDTEGAQLLLRVEIELLIRCAEAGAPARFHH